MSQGWVICQPTVKLGAMREDLGNLCPSGSFFRCEKAEKGFLEPWPWLKGFFWLRLCIGTHNLRFSLEILRLQKK